MIGETLPTLEDSPVRCAAAWRTGEPPRRAAERGKHEEDIARRALALA